MPHSPVVALARAKAAETFAANMCLKFVRTRFGVGPLAGDAAEGFGISDERHTSTPPRGVPVWWTGGKHGHVAISAGNGYVISTDWPRRGTVGRVSIATLTNSWNKTYRGWSEDINEVHVFDRPTVDLSVLVQAAKADPHRPQGETTAGATDDVKRVEAALYIEGLLDEKFAFDGSFGSKTLSAYAAWQRKIGMPTRTEHGLPGLESLRRLGKKYEFRVQG
jgi:hypothetical protein